VTKEKTRSGGASVRWREGKDKRKTGQATRHSGGGKERKRSKKKPPGEKENLRATGTRNEKTSREKKKEISL